MTMAALATRVAAATARHKARLLKLRKTLEPKDPLDAPLSAYAKYDEAVADENQAYTDEILDLVERYTAGPERKGKRK